jgi:hypothetical protein
MQSHRISNKHKIFLLDIKFISPVRQARVSEPSSSDVEKLNRS